ncbi:MAG: MFS transporter [Lachnospiraceae bacterium]|nr:MFS transporter [Lachnospiraceae bacterium]
MYLSYGFMQGTGQGMIYAVILPTAQNWFPDRLGFASGIIVASNGLCGLILSPVCSILLPRAGAWGAFMIIGSVIALAWIMNIIFYCGPDTLSGAGAGPGAGAASKAGAASAASGGVAESERKDTRRSSQAQTPLTGPRQYTTGEMLRTGKFYLLLFTMMFGLITYFILSPVTQTYQASIGISPAIAVSAVMFGSILNSAIRLILPAASDRFGRSTCIKAVLAAGILALFLLTSFENYAVTLAIIIMYGCFGGIMGSFPAFTSSIFGLEHAGENYGCVMLGIVAASFGAPAVTAAITSAGGSMKTVFFISMLLEIAGLICLIILERLLRSGTRS